MYAIDHESEVPYYQQLVQILLSQIKSENKVGKMKGGYRLPSIEEIGKRYGVSSITVRRALQELQKRGLIYKRPGKGTFVTRKEVTIIPTRRKFKILALMAEGKNPEFVDLLEGLQREIEKEKEIELQIKFSKWDPKVEAMHLTRFMNSSSYAGLLLRLTDSTSERQIIALKERGKPFILIGRHFQNLDTNIVAMDNVNISYEMTKLLLERGKRKIWYFEHYDSSYDKSSICVPIKSGYLKALSDACIPYDSQMVLTGLSTEISRNDKALNRQINRICESCKDELGFLITSDNVAMRILNSLARVNGEVRTDIGIAGFDLSAPKYFHIPFITAYTNYSQMGVIAAEKLKQILGGENKSTVRELLKTDILEFDGYRSYKCLVSEKKYSGKFDEAVCPA